MQEKKDSSISVILKGICVGGTMLVPGCSGGSMAMILGVYDRLVSSVSSFMKHKKESLFFLTLFCLGGGLGMILFARPILSLMERFEMPMLYFFIGAIAGSVPMILKKASWEKGGLGKLLFFLAGAAAVGLFALLPPDTFQADMSAGLTSYLLLILAGVIAAIALVLPGISVSYMLLLMGMYDTVMRAITEMYLPYLIPIGLGLALGVVATTKLLEKAMEKFPGPSYLCILGFMAASMAQVFPGLPSGGRVAGMPADAGSRIFTYPFSGGGGNQEVASNSFPLRPLLGWS